MNELHQRYAQEISALGGIKSPALRRALAMVRREDFLPPGPWLIESLEGSYYPSDDDAVDHILHAVGVAIDADRLLNNANPAKICVQIERADIRPGETVVHVGAGFGYFSALMAELVGPSGTVVAAEIDPHLRKQAGVNLAAWPQVRMTGDALRPAPLRPAVRQCRSRRFAARLDSGLEIGRAHDRADDRWRQSRRRFPLL